MEVGEIKGRVLSLLLRPSVLLKAMSQHPLTLPCPTSSLVSAHPFLPCPPKGCRDALNVSPTVGSLCRLWTPEILKCLPGTLCHLSAGSMHACLPPGYEGAVWSRWNSGREPGLWRAILGWLLQHLLLLHPQSLWCKWSCSPRHHRWAQFSTWGYVWKLHSDDESKGEGSGENDWCDDFMRQGVQSIHYSLAHSRTQQTGGLSSPQGFPACQSYILLHLIHLGFTPLHMEIWLHWYEGANYYKRHNYKTGNGFIDAVSGRGSRSGSSGCSVLLGAKMNRLLALGLLVYRETCS